MYSIEELEFFIDLEKECMYEIEFIGNFEVGIFLDLDMFVLNDVWNNVGDM